MHFSPFLKKARREIEKRSYCNAAAIMQPAQGQVFKAQDIKDLCLWMYSDSQLCLHDNF